MKLEDDRQRRLRRVDWRFLLPTPPPRRAICFAGGPLAESVGEIAELVLPQHETVRECDLSVVVDPDAATLEAAFEALRPGGACYGEWRAFRGGSPQRLRQRLEAVGFADVTCYWRWPVDDRSSPQFWLPLDAEQALAYFLGTRTPARTRPRRLGQLALQAIWRVAFRLRLLRPVCFVARKPQAGASRAEGVLAAIADRWERLGLGRRPDRLSWILLTGGASVTNKLVALVFADDEQRPSLVAKLARVPESQPALEREAANLRAIHAGRQRGVPGVPRLLFFDRNGWGAVGETVLGGRPLTRLLDRAHYRELALGVTDWLCELAGEPAPTARAGWWERLVEKPLDDFARSFADAAAPDELRLTRTLLDGLGDLPLVPEQRDCAPWNILVDGDGALIVHDWESSEPRGLPLLDLVYFLSYGAFFLDGAMESNRFEESYRATFDSSMLTGAVTAACEQRYLDRLGLDPGVVPPLRALCWVIHSRSTSPRAQSLFRLLLREELRRARPPAPPTDRSAR